MADFVTVAKLSDLEEGEGKVVEVNGREIAMFNVDGNFYAIDNTCKHANGPLGEGMLDGNIVTCPWHRWKYDIITGKCTFNPQIKVDTYEVKVEGGEVKVRI